MKRKIDLESDFDFFKGEIIGTVLVLNFKDNLMFRATSLETKSTILDYLDQLSRTDAIKVLLLVSSPKKAGKEEYSKFYNQVIQSVLDINAVHKLFHAVDDLILKIKEINQIVIHADNGNVLPLFLNISLACDYRIVADNTVFQNPCLEYGLVPKGGGAFFLSKILGTGGAYRIMLSEEDITAGEALKLGLVDEIAAFNELQDAAFKVAEDFARKPSRSLRCCKRLLNFSFKELREYLEFETDELTKMIGPFGNGLAKSGS
jgi:2-(1,2-epoxy-1,2-dihydrophenyl)acetyl-CoA isomerase